MRRIAPLIGVFILLACEPEAATAQDASGVLFVVSLRQPAEADRLAQVNAGIRQVREQLGATPLGLIDHRGGDCRSFTHSIPIGDNATVAPELDRWPGSPRAPSVIDQMLAQAGARNGAIGIVLIADTGDACHPDPCSAVRDLDDSLLSRLRLDVIEFAAGAGPSDRLGCLAADGRGRHFSVTDPARAFAEIGADLRAWLMTEHGLYLGCYRDQGVPDDAITKRDIDGYTFASQDLTTASCTAVCRKREFPFAATQYSAQCYCGHRYGRSGTADNCDMRCAGDRSTFCGGAWANSVYQLFETP